MVRTYRRSVSLRAVPNCVRRVGNMTTEFRRRHAARRLPWSRLNDQQREIALRVVVEGKAVYA